jgi:Carboxypeptidase regulatory-like domain
MLAAVILLLAAAPATAQVVEGTLRNAFTGAPVAGAKAVVQKNGLGLYYSFTDANGNFRIENVPDGAYTVAYSAEGYGFTLGSQFYTEIRVTAGTPVHVEGNVVQFQKVLGRVVDGRGDPVKGCRVSLRGRLTNGTVVTDENGTFRLPILRQEDSAILAVMPPAGWKPPEPDPETGEARAWAQTYYPGVANQSLAAPILLPPSGDLEDVQMKLLAVPLHPVRGVLLDPRGAPVAKTTIGLWIDAPGDAVHRTESRADGSFEFKAVPEGDWHLTTGEVEDGEATLQAQDWIEVRRRGIDGLKVRLAAPFDLPGRAIFQGREGMPAPRSPRYTLDEYHAGRRALNGISRAAAGDPDGEFQFHNLYPGSYAIRVGAPAPSPYYLDAIRLGDVPVVGDIELSAVSPPLTIVYKSDGGKVLGTVSQCNSGMVALVPQDNPMLPILTGKCDAKDRYEVVNVRPGDYRAVALPGRRVWLGEVDPVLLQKASRVTVRAGETTQADLP